MKKDKKIDKPKDKKESAESMKKQTSDPDTTHKGYNEKNPSQPEGAFIIDSKTGKKP
jgi:hypothetical protein